MLAFLRYALATVFFAASIGCLVLWGWTELYKSRQVTARYNTASWTANFLTVNGAATLYIGKGVRAARWEFDSREMGPFRLQFATARQRNGLFDRFGNGIHFPLWYPALIFALAGVAALRFHRQFSIRSALVCLTVVAALLGMVVAL